MGDRGVLVEVVDGDGCRRATSPRRTCRVRADDLPDLSALPLVLSEGFLGLSGPWLRDPELHGGSGPG